MTCGGYELLDSGAGRKLERFGDKVLDRPCSTAIWKRRLKNDLWGSADATFSGGSNAKANEGGWEFRAAPIVEWIVELDGISMVARTQRNGQVGIFPEHLSYLPQIDPALKALMSTAGTKPKVLNLFGYTGLASLLCLKLGASVTHVDNSKRALEWFSNNLELNKLGSAEVRLIEDDAISFMQREVRRGNSYEIIVADPPSFSRVSKSKNWDLEEVFGNLMESISASLNKSAAMLVFTSHHPILGPEVALNLLRDSIDQMNFDYEVVSMNLKEGGSSRCIPAGAGLVVKFGFS